MRRVMADVCIHTTRPRDREQPHLCTLCIQASGHRVPVRRVQGRAVITCVALRRMASMRGQAGRMAVPEDDLE